LNTGDVDLAGITDRYVRSKITAGQVISVDNTDVVPLIEPHTTLLTVAVPPIALRFGQIDAQQSVDLCKVVNNATVVAAFCGRRDDGQCVLLTAVNSGKSPTVNVPSSGIELCPTSLDAKQR
jgi:hypothetical protein